MTEIQELEIIIRADGVVRLQVQGVSGPNCLNLTEDIERILGNNITERTFTDQYYEQQDIEDFMEARVKV
jgi:hypothetical protein